MQHKSSMKYTVWLVTFTNVKTASYHKNPSETITDMFKLRQLSLFLGSL